jgi:hypothetical protein
MSRLFHDIQGYFKATYSGRYLAFILAELFRQDQHAFTRVLNEAGVNYSHKRGDRAIANRWLFPMAQRRFADIAIVNAAGYPLVLIEIKDADIKNENNAAQIDDYIKFIGQKKNHNVSFLFLSRTVPPDKEERQLQTAKDKTRVHRMFFRQLHKPLMGSTVFGQMVSDYLEDINVAYHSRKPDLKTINYITNLMLGIGGRKATEKSVPQFFEIAFGNLSSTGQWIKDSNPNLFKQSFKRCFYVKPCYDMKRLNDVTMARSRKSAAPLIVAESLDRYCRGGEVGFYTGGYITKNNTKIYLEFGYWSHTKRRSSKPISYRHSRGMYATMQWSPWKDGSKDTIHKYDSFRSFPDEEAFQKAERTFFRRTKSAALARKSCPKGVKTILRKFVVP